MKKHSYPGVWGEGALFAASGFDGKTDYSFEIISSLLPDRIGLSIYSGSLKGIYPSAEFWIEAPKCGLPACDRKRSSVAGDFLELKFKAETIAFTALESGAFAGNCSAPGARFILKSLGPARAETSGKIIFIKTKEGFLAASGEGAETYKFYLPSCAFKNNFAVVYGRSKRDCREKLARILKTDISSSVLEKKLVLQNLMPEAASRIKNRGLLDAAAKAVSVLKVNVQSARALIPSRWTTPDRKPHRDMWLWDSAFHSIGWSFLDRDMARDALTAVFLTQRRNGFIPIRAEHKGKQTQPPILAWAALELFKRSNDKGLLEELYGKLAKFLVYFEKNRRDRATGLFFWVKEFNTLCRAGESGLDNSPLYDGDEKQLSCDLSSYMARSYEDMASIASCLGKLRETLYWRNKYGKLKLAINRFLWDNESGFYYDREAGGQLILEKCATGFYPAFAGAVSKERLITLLKHLNNSSEFKTAFPVPTVSKDSSRYGKDMWRGPAWINSNWLIIEGLLRYGKRRLARALAAKTVGEIARWYAATGVLCEYYDAEGTDDPRYLPRKNYGGSGYLGVIRDYGWTAAGYIRLLQLLYGKRS